MKTNKQEAYNKMLKYAERIAENYGLDQREEDKNTFWADFGTIVTYWKCEKHIDIRLVFRTRFGNPRIDFHNANSFASVELSDEKRPTGKRNEKGEDIYEYDGVFRPYEIQAWGVNGLKLANKMWEELSQLIHKPVGGFITEE